MRKLKLFSDDRSLFNIIEPYLSDVDNESQNLNSMFERLFPSIDKPIFRVLDLGCGEGKTRDFFKSFSSAIEWHGCDIDSSPEVFRRIDHSDIVNFDGVNIPFDKNYFDYIHCNQVFEHVRHPEKLLLSIIRVLAPGGTLALSVSHLEPYHSYSIFNFTPYGMHEVLIDSGFSLQLIHPGVDCFRLIKRRFDNRKNSLTECMKLQSPVENIIEKSAMHYGVSVKEVNYLKLLYSGQFIVIAKKPIILNKI